MDSSIQAALSILTRSMNALNILWEKRTKQPVVQITLLKRRTILMPLAGQPMNLRILTSKTAIELRRKWSDSLISRDNSNSCISKMVFLLQSTRKWVSDTRTSSASSRWERKSCRFSRRAIRRLCTVSIMVHQNLNVDSISWRMT